MVAQRRASCFSVILTANCSTSSSNPMVAGLGAKFEEKREPAHRHRSGGWPESVDPDGRLEKRT
jgi:hypothetical protein